MLCVDRLGSVNIVATLDVAVSGTDSRTGREVNFSGQYQHAPPARGVSGISDPQQRARAGNCPSFVPGAFVMLGTRTQGDLRSNLEPFKWSDWVPNTSPVLTPNGNGGTIPEMAYVTATMDFMLPDYIDGIGKQIYAGKSYVISQGRWEDLSLINYGVRPTSSLTYAWQYNIDPVLSSGGLINGQNATVGACYVCDRNAIVDPPIDQIYDLYAGEIVQAMGGHWMKLSELRYAGGPTDPFWQFFCQSMWDVTAYLPNTGGVEDPDSGPIWLNGAPQSNMFLGYAPPAAWQNPMSAYLRRYLDREAPEIPFMLWDDSAQLGYNGKVIANSTNEWQGTFEDPDTGITVDATYHFTITRV